MTGLTDNEVKFLQERFAASKAGVEAAEQRPLDYAVGFIRDFDGVPLFEIADATPEDARYVVAVVNLMPRLLAHYLELRAGTRRPDSDTDKEQDRDPLDGESGVCRRNSPNGYVETEEDAIRPWPQAEWPATYEYHGCGDGLLREHAAPLPPEPSETKEAP